MQWLKDIECEMNRMNEQWESDEPYFEAGEDLGSAIEMNDKLIAAVKLATKALMLTQHCAVDDVIGFVCPMCCEPHGEGHAARCVIGDTLAQLQSGEFPTGGGE